MKYSQSDIDNVRKAANIHDFIPDLKGSGASRYTVCPKCGKTGKNKGLIVTHKANMDLAKCFSCGYTINGAIEAVMEYRQVKFPEALKIVADRSGVYLMTPKEKKTKAVKEIKKVASDSFCERQLAASGLTFEDVMARVKVSDDNATIIETSPFQRGGVDAYWNVNNTDDEMLIHYYDLNGRHVQYASRGIAGRLKNYVRVRWSNPDIHTDANGRPIKYQTPRGAQTKLYIPQYIRSLFQQQRAFDTLIVQEGEKKAEKACKHGIASVGIQGIYNIGNEDSGLIKELQYLIQTCKIKNVVLLLDSDWDHLHKEIGVGDHVDQRPNQFAKAVIKFKQYLLTMHNLGVSIDVYFGHIKENEKHDKGIDDLLVNSLSGNEQLLKDDIDATLFSHDGIGKYVDIFKISSKSDYQIKDYWLLNDRDAFFNRHKERLSEVLMFRFGKVSYKVENDQLIRASRYNSERDFWSYETNEKTGKRTVNFEYIEALQFITSNGFFRIHTLDCNIDEYKYVRVDDGVVNFTGPSEIRDFVYSYVLQTVKSKDVLNMFAAKLGTLLSVDKLERMEKLEDNFDEFEPGIQRFYFSNGCLTVTPQNMQFGDIIGYVWSDRVMRRNFKRVPIIENIIHTEVMGYEIKYSEQAQNCEFLRFLINASNFWHRSPDTMTAVDKMEWQQHVVNKITAIGYLLCDFKYQSELKAVVAMDGQMGDVGQSNGRSGKSLIGVALSKLVDQAIVDGRSTANDDQFIYSGVTPRTRNIFIDDVRVNFDFERFYPAITSDLQVNPKQQARFKIINERSPKLYITTNHAINAQSTSAIDRMTYIVFSDYYNDEHKPVNDFGHQFFVDWDEEQWNLFYNFMAECVYWYLKSMSEVWYRVGQGAVPPPMKDVRLRTLKQLMGEAFFQWAEVFFDPASANLNIRIMRKDAYDKFHAAFPESRLQVAPTKFKDKIKQYCQFKGYHFNISRPNKEHQTFAEFIEKNPGKLFVGEDDKSAGVEYFTLTTQDFSVKQPF